MTYAEHCGMPVADWDTILKELINKPAFKDMETIVHLARTWDCCKVGNSDLRVERSKVGAPIDDVLYKLGSKFAFHMMALGQIAYPTGFDFLFVCQEEDLAFRAAVRIYSYEQVRLGTIEIANLIDIRVKELLYEQEAMDEMVDLIAEVLSEESCETLS